MQTGMWHTVHEHKALMQGVRPVTAIFVALFVLVQVLLDVHHHIDHGHFHDEEGAPSAECLQCLAAAHFVADTAPKLVIQIPTYSVSDRVAGPLFSGNFTALVLNGRPRAPPMARF